MILAKERGIDMFIDNVMSYLWKEEYQKYINLYESCMKMDEKDLFENLKKANMSTLEYPGLTMNLLATSGCPHKFKKEKISGCSMCDYHSEFTDAHAAMAALREKNIDLYTKVISSSFTNVRGTLTDPNIIELVSGND
ncbi:MAG TPA: radical SAM protein, partial [Ruminiclostridium sp.]|nr:radical SAM protein [Ruminiclostridium sp.]